MRAVAFVVASLVAGQLPAQQQQAAANLSVEQIAARARNAVVLLRAYGQDGKIIALGSGFIAPDGRVVTNSHVVEGATRVEIVDADGHLLMSAPHADALSTSVDIAVLPKLPAPPATLGLSSVSPAVGSPVVAIGAPEGLTNTVSSGIVSAIRKVRAGQWIQISAPLSSGSSGGPVIGPSGEVIGVSVAQLIEGQNLNFAIPSADVRAMLQSPPSVIAFPPSAVDSTPTTPRLPAPVAKGFFNSLPATPETSLHDTEFLVNLLGCYGNTSNTVVICVLDFWNTKHDDYVTLFRAGVKDFAGTSVGADYAITAQHRTYHLGQDKGIRLQGGTGSSRIFVRFIARHIQDGSVTLSIELGGPFVKRVQSFAPVAIHEIYANDDERSWLFGSP